MGNVKSYSKWFQFLRSSFRVTSVLFIISMFTTKFTGDFVSLVVGVIAGINFILLAVTFLVESILKARK